ncbi:MAG: glycosyltransferase family 2 protein [Bacteroidetes bacterium]|nr:glycosyltransferase family 2 protein [Bacteroidota bacterium]
MPKISVVVPVYNTASYLAECLNSIMNQTFNDIEIICVNDGSTDDSPLMLESFKNKDERIVVINKKNGGLSSARNTGIKHAKGEYVYFIDSDDYLELDAFERLNKSILEDKPQVVCFGLKAFLDPSFTDATFDLAGKEKYYERSYLEEKVYSGPELYEVLLAKNNFVFSCCLYLTERKFLLQTSIIFYEGLLHEDELFTRLLFLKPSV